jgi:hypothetical protein
MLLDKLLDPSLLYTVADRAALEADLARRLAGSDGTGTSDRRAAETEERISSGWRRACAAFCR